MNLVINTDLIKKRTLIVIKIILIVYATIFLIGLICGAPISNILLVLKIITIVAVWFTLMCSIVVGAFFSIVYFIMDW
jgi:hypothetical protein